MLRGCGHSSLIVHSPLYLNPSPSTVRRITHIFHLYRSYQDVCARRSYHATAGYAACSIETGPEQPEAETLPAGYVLFHPPFITFFLSFRIHYSQPYRREAKDRRPLPSYLAERPPSCLDDGRRRCLHQHGSSVSDHALYAATAINKSTGSRDIPTLSPTPPTTITTTTTTI